MSVLDHDGDERTVRSLRCSTCGRCFIACGEADEIVCGCGAKLIPVPLADGVYEVTSLVPADVRATMPTGLRAALPEEEDLGYGASHGNPPGHEGPTGPGDVPAR